MSCFTTRRKTKKKVHRAKMNTNIPPAQRIITTASVRGTKSTKEWYIHTYNTCVQCEKKKGGEKKSRGLGYKSCG
jgi:hypothetical protein